MATSSVAQRMSERTLMGDRPQMAYASLEEAFPEADPGVRPAGSRVLVQVRTPKKKSAGGIILTDDTKDTEMWNSQVARVIALGPVAFKNRDTLAPWPEGDWCAEGSYVRVPKYGGDKWIVQTEGEPAIFQLIKDLDVLGVVTGDPMAVVAYI